MAQVNEKEVYIKRVEKMKINLAKIDRKIQKLKNKLEYEEDLRSRISEMTKEYEAIIKSLD